VTENLSDQQRLVLTALAGYPGVASPQMLAQRADAIALSWWARDPHHSWQGIARTMASLVRRDLAVRIQSSAATMYEITDKGRKALKP